MQFVSIFFIVFRFFAAYLRQKNRTRIRFFATDKNYAERPTLTTLNMLKYENFILLIDWIAGNTDVVYTSHCSVIQSSIPTQSNGNVFYENHADMIISHSYPFSTKW